MWKREVFKQASSPLLAQVNSIPPDKPQNPAFNLGWGAMSKLDIPDAYYTSVHHGRAFHFVWEAYTIAQLAHVRVRVVNCELAAT